MESKQFMFKNQFIYLYNIYIAEQCTPLWAVVRLWRYGCSHSWPLVQGGGIW